MPRALPKILLSLDPGGSQTKSIYLLPKDEKPRYQLMAPELEEISRDDFDRYMERESKLSNPAPNKQAYLEVNKQIFAVGYFATKFGAEDRLEEVKYENALYKVLAAVGAIVAENNLNPQRISLQLSILLPWNEYEDRKRFKQKLIEYLKDFTFRGKAYSIELGEFVCRPEGGGLAALYNSKKGERWFQEHRIGVLMFGHRNITALNFDYGELTGDSPKIGFYQFLDRVVRRTSGLDRNSLVQAIFKAIKLSEYDKFNKRHGSKVEIGFYFHAKDAEHIFYPCWKKFQPIQELASARDVDLRNQEVDAIHQALEVARGEYWETVSKWLKKVFPHDLDLVIISGGAAKFLQSDLEKHFNLKHECAKSEWRTYKRTGNYVAIDNQKPSTPIIWGSGSVNRIKETLSIEEKKEQRDSLSYRLVDVYGMFEVLVSKCQKRKKPSAKSTKQKEAAS